MLLTTLQGGVYSCARQHATWNYKSFACAATAVRCQLSLTAVRSPAVHSQPQAGISDAKFQMPVSTTQGKQAVSRDASSSFSSGNDAQISHRPAPAGRAISSSPEYDQRQPGYVRAPSHSLLLWRTSASQSLACLAVRGESLQQGCQ